MELIHSICGRGFWRLLTGQEDQEGGNAVLGFTCVGAAVETAPSRGWLDQPTPDPRRQTPSWTRRPEPQHSPPFCKYGTIICDLLGICQV